MCKDCGCDSDQVTLSPVHGTTNHHHIHDHQHEHHREPLKPQQRTLELHQSLLSESDSHADDVRARLAQSNTLAINLLSSPGAGKTTLLVETLKALKSQHPDLPCKVIEGDQQTQNDAERIAATGYPALQINTGTGCHLDGKMLMAALDTESPPESGILFIENVGNLVCPAYFDLGEKSKVVILSVTEGDDKPLKYPDAFQNADLLIISKRDLLPYVDFDVDACIERARMINPDIIPIQISAKTGQGLDEWQSWLMASFEP